jgi:hypothetical protein
VSELKHFGGIDEIDGRGVGIMIEEHDEISKILDE